MKKLTIQNEGRDIIGVIPETWEELKVKHYLLLESDLGDIDFISAFMDIPRKDVENITGNLSPVIEAIAELFNKKPPNLEEAKKKVLTMEGKEIHFPNTLNLTRYGQKSMLKNILQKEGGLESELATIFAIYAQPLIDGRFDSSRIEDVKLLVDELPLLDVYPYVVFFFEKSNALRKHLRAKSKQFLQL